MSAVRTVEVPSSSTSRQFARGDERREQAAVAGQRALQRLSLSTHKIGLRAIATSARSGRVQAWIGFYV